MKVFIHQPDFAPWWEYFRRWAYSDLFIVLDDVQFLRQGWHHRDRVKTAQGVRWLTVPVQKKGRYEQTIAEAEISYETPWRRKHLELLRAAYGRTPQFALVHGMLAELYAAKPVRLFDLNWSFLRAVAELLGIATPFLFASATGVGGAGAERILALVRQAGGTVYLTGAGSRAYLSEAVFREAGVALEIAEGQGPVYGQPHGEFCPGLSVVDYLMCMPREQWSVRS
ncbi:MAG: WbqC family protein [Desulfovibrionaceae bacterium]